MILNLMRRHRMTLLLSGLMVCTLLLWANLPKAESTLQIRACRQGVSMPDGFFVWHHLDANGIHFKSITPEDDSLLIKFDSSAQSEAAKAVLYKTLPRGYVIALRDESSPNWLSRLRSHGSRIG